MEFVPSWLILIELLSHLLPNALHSTAGHSLKICGESQFRFRNFNFHSKLFSLNFRTVVEAENLVNADAGMLSFLSGKSDPYVKIFMNSENQAITQVISDNLNPVWNYEKIMRTYRDDVSVQFNVRYKKFFKSETKLSCTTLICQLAEWP